MPDQVLCDLSGHLGGARDQGTRRTCVAFAASEAHAVSIGPYNPLSCEYAYYHAYLRHGTSDPNCGVSLAAMVDAIELDGQPQENGWPYLRKLPTDLSLWHPPAKVGHLFNMKGRHLVPSIESTISCLDSGSPVVMGLRISNVFYELSNAKIIEEVSGDVDTGNHAVLAIGHGLKNNERLLLIQNSWGLAWRNQGMVWLTEGYLSSRIKALAQIG